MILFCCDPHHEYIHRWRKQYLRLSYRDLGIIFFSSFKNCARSCSISSAHSVFPYLIWVSHISQASLSFDYYFQNLKLVLGLWKCISFVFSSIKIFFCTWSKFISQNKHDFFYYISFFFFQCILDSCRTFN